MGPFYKKLNFDTLYRPKGKRSENALNKHIQNHKKKLVLQICYCATFVETTPIAQTSVEFYEIAHFLSKTTSFIKKLPPFYKKLQITSL